MNSHHMQYVYSGFSDTCENCSWRSLTWENSRSLTNNGTFNVVTMRLCVCFALNLC